MKKKTRIILGCTLALLAVAFTIIVAFVDVAGIGPGGSKVGLSHFNDWFRNLIGDNHTIYVITDYAMFIPLLVALGFAVLGVFQWIKRKSFLKVDREIFTLGAFYIVLAVIFVVFDFFVKINYRPILIDGFLEASYPSTHALLTVFVCPSAVMVVKSLYGGKKWARPVNLSLIMLMILLVVGRIVSGVHWMTDIIGGTLMSCALVVLFSAFYRAPQKSDENKAKEELVQKEQ